MCIPMYVDDNYLHRNAAIVSSPSAYSDLALEFIGIGIRKLHVDV